MKQFKVFKVKVGSFSILLERHNDGKLTAQALCRNSFELGKAFQRLGG